MGGSSRAARPFHHPWKDAKQLSGSSQEHGATKSRESPGDTGRIGELCRSKEGAFNMLARVCVAPGDERGP